MSQKFADVIKILPKICAEVTLKMISNSSRSIPPEPFVSQASNNFSTAARSGGWKGKIIKVENETRDEIKGV